MAEIKKKISRKKKKQLLKRLKERMATKKKYLYLAAFLAWLQFLMRLCSFYIIAKQFSTVLLTGQLELWSTFTTLVVLTLLGYGFALLAKPLQGLASQHARDSLKESFFEAFVAMDGQLDQQTSEADILTLASQGIDSLDTYYSYYLPLAMRTLFNCSTVLFLVLLIYPTGALIFLLVLPLIPLSIIAMQKRSEKIMTYYWDSYMDVGNLFMDDLKGLNTLYAYQVDHNYESNFVAKAEEFRKATMTLLGFQLQAVGYMDAVMYLGIGLSGFFAIQSLLAGHLSYFNVLFFILIATEFFTPIREKGYGMHLVMMNTKMADRIFSFLDSVDGHTSDKEVALMPFDQVIIQDVTYSHHDKAMLENISLSLEKGKITAFAGVSGLGKTSLANLLLKTYQADAGSIQLGDVAIEELSKEAIRHEVLYISDQSSLLNRSIYDNLVMAKALSKQEMLAWLEKHQLLTFIHDLSEGIDTIVGENGNRLSPGQQQQVICARAILCQRSLYIFDEVTASLDAENEAIIYRMIESLAKTSIVLVITHKMKCLKKVDTILFLSPNQAALVGTYEELYVNNGAFGQLADTQDRLEASLNVKEKR
ncbi:ABC transporter ATP-binding protein/permease [Streptococcus iniae]|uniref:ABC transporter ATP-binding protein n=1 Tax=Streptococcus iniae TaxID=1346 RepID=A0ABN4DA90_STRIN|nr:ABC transporter ATP-binding protein/permease [Streptococcus iniae]AGM99541.1 ABC transporter, ATP-binding protein [Streptococcus iniae SF1]AHY16465.1 ABC transporter ATP-binding protein [Streptococcus iniae]AHY18328.1 ABC transporter ATP-binding protein [Streptococcus iniae]AJG26611.1 ABC transporter ATP-binding protein [Streptococcus iniae]APD32486.1 ABC transporter ATP-binding protein [Streptococcus iniae]